MNSDEVPASDGLKDRYDKLWEHRLGLGRHAMGDLNSTVQFLERIDLPQRQSRVLEIGCGTGALSDWLVNKGFESVTAVDLSQRAVDVAARLYPSVNFRQMGAEELTFPNESFEVCMSFDLVEHVPKIDRHLAEAARVLVPNGKYYLQTPNILTNSIAETIWNKGFSWRWQHPSLQSSRSLRRRLREAGFRDIEFVKISPVTDYKLDQLPKALGSVLRLIPFERMPLFVQTNFWVVATK